MSPNPNGPTKDTHTEVRQASDEGTPLLQGQKQHSTFSNRQKKYIIMTAAFASSFSPISANIYYPALNSIATDLHISASLINLTITTYMIFQGLAPTFVGSLSDSAGRRPVYIICFTIYISANLALALQHSYPALLILRAIQSSGSSGTVALASAVAADLVTFSERGRYMGLASLGSIMGPTLGPSLGGLLSEYLGWRSIFWFLAVSAATVFIPMLLFYPETCRNVVGNGSIPPPRWNRSCLNYYRNVKARHIGDYSGDENQSHPTKRRHSSSSNRLRVLNPLATLRILFELPTGLVLLCNGILFAGYYFVTSSVPSQFRDIYGVNDLQMGLIFIAPGFGTPMGAWLNGYLVDWNYRRVQAHQNQRQNCPPAKTVAINGSADGRGSKERDLDRFPIEKARLQIALPMLYVGAVCVILYGWLIHLQVTIFFPIALLFLIGFSVTACFNVMNVLIVDLNYSTPATAIATNNLVRCFLGAGSTALVHPILNALGRAWTYTALAGVWIVLVGPIIGVICKYGFRWRRGRKDMRFEEEEEERRIGAM
ncbi:hypothetical protein ACLMJK_007559 [Lecanora helva]